MRRTPELLVAIGAAVSLNLLSTTPVAGIGRPGLTPVACPAQAWEFGDPAFEALPDATAFFGRYDGGLYRIEIPSKWNGELVLSAHGFRSNAGAKGSSLTVGFPSTLRAHLVEGGFAWAASSYRCNGYAPGIGLQDTMALTDLMTKFSQGRTPLRTYLTGTSMGGHVTVLGMHEFPTTFAGGLAMCPAGPELFDFFTGVGAAAEVITGVQFRSIETMQEDLARMTATLGKAPDYTVKGRQLASVEIDLSGGPRPFAVEGLTSRFAPNISGAALAGGLTASNRAVATAHLRYTLDESLGLTSSQLNGSARRKTADPDLRNPNGPFDELIPFDGRLERPLLTMHGTGDLFVPIALEQTLRGAVDAAGTGDRLVQRVYRIAGHCGFSPAEEARSFDDLVRWVRDGTKPAGDNVLGDLTDAGRPFTNPLRPGDPGTVRVVQQP